MSKKKFLKWKKKNTDHKKIVKLTKMVKVLKPELKYYDLSLSATVDYNGTIVNLLNSISQGDTQSQRNGSKIRLHSIQFKGIMTGNTGVSAVSQVLREMIVIGNQENSTNLTVPNILQLTGSVNTPFSAYNWDQRKKFRIERDQTHIVPAGEFAGGITAVNACAGYKPTYVHYYHKLNFVTTYQAATTNVANHGLYYVFASDSATNLPSVQGYFRITYTDI